MWVANKSQALGEQCGPFISLLIVKATVWLRDLKLSLIAIYILIGHHGGYSVQKLEQSGSFCLQCFRHEKVGV